MLGCRPALSTQSGWKIKLDAIKRKRERYDKSFEERALYISLIEGVCAVK